MVYRFAVKTYRLPLRSPLRTAHGIWAIREGLIIRLEAENGTVSYGEVAPLPQFGTETLAESLERCLSFGDKTDDVALDDVPERFGCVRFALAAARSAKADADREKRLPVTALLPAGKAALAVLPAKMEQGRHVIIVVGK